VVASPGAAVQTAGGEVQAERRGFRPAQGQGLEGLKCTVAFEAPTGHNALPSWLRDGVPRAAELIKSLAASLDIAFCAQRNSKKWFSAETDRPICPQASARFSGPLANQVPRSA
jgi:hypothetical protein